MNRRSHNERNRIFGTDNLFAFDKNGSGFARSACTPTMSLIAKDAEQYYADESKNKLDTTKALGWIGCVVFCVASWIGIFYLVLMIAT